jgi:hypothetical protein
LRWVGQIEANDGYAVLATGNPDANDMARRIADGKAPNFICGSDERLTVGTPMPDFSGSGN